MQLHKVLYCVLAMSDQNMSLISSPGHVVHASNLISQILTLLAYQTHPLATIQT